MFEEKKGFTMVEVIAVVFLLSLLSLIAYTSFSNTKTSATTTSLLASVDHILSAEETYYDTFNDFQIDVTKISSLTGSADSNTNFSYTNGSILLGVASNTLSVTKSISTNSNSYFGIAGTDGTTCLLALLTVDSTGKIFNSRSSTSSSGECSGNAALSI